MGCFENSFSVFIGFCRNRLESGESIPILVVAKLLIGSFDTGLGISIAAAGLLNRHTPDTHLH